MHPSSGHVRYDSDDGYSSVTAVDMDMDVGMHGDEEEGYKYSNREHHNRRRPFDAIAVPVFNNTVTPSAPPIFPHRRI